MQQDTENNHKVVATKNILVRCDAKIRATVVCSERAINTIIVGCSRYIHSSRQIFVDVNNTIFTVATALLTSKSVSIRKIFVLGTSTGNLLQEVHTLNSVKRRIVFVSSNVLPSVDTSVSSAIIAARSAPTGTGVGHDTVQDTWFQQLIELHITTSVRGRSKFNSEFLLLYAEAASVEKSAHQC